MISLNQDLWFGVVEDVFDPEEDGKVRVRIVGKHNPDKNMVPTNTLPWAEVFLPPTNAAISGVGLAPVGLVNGSMVMGIFKDADDCQEPIVLFVSGGKRSKFINSQYGFNDPDGYYPKDTVDSDINPLARGKTAGVASLETKSDNRVEGVDIDGATQPKPEPVDPEKYKDTPWMPFVLGELGVTEEKNPDRVKTYHSVGGGLSASETVAWCSSFANWSVIQAKIKGTRSAMARSWVNWGKSVGTEKIPYGAIVVMRGTRGPSSGHVLFCTKDLGDKFEGVGGNQSTTDGKRFDTGGAVTRTVFKKENVIDCRFPTGA